MFLVFYRIKYPVAQHLEGHQEFTEKSLDLWLWWRRFFAAKGFWGRGQPALCPPARESGGAVSSPRGVRAKHRPPSDFTTFEVFRCLFADC